MLVLAMLAISVLGYAVIAQPTTEGAAPSQSSTVGGTSGGEGPSGEAFSQPSTGNPTTLSRLRAPSPSANEEPAATPRGAITSFVTRRGTLLTLNGRPFEFRGFNVYNINGDGDCGYAIPNLDTELSAMGSQVNVVRGWFFQFTATNHTTKGRDWRKMDATLATLRSRGIRVIATLADEWGACEGSQPRSPLTIDWYRGGYRTTPYDRDVSASYRDWVAQVVTRYKDDPTILAWQLMNEPTAVSDASNACPDQDAAFAALRQWASDIAALVKRIDHHHLLSVGTSGSSQCGTTGSRYAALHAIQAVDLCESHDYTPPGVSLPDGVMFEIAACRSLNKPIVDAEVGIRGSEVGCSPTVRAADLRAKITAQISAGIRGALIWAWRSAGDGGTDRCGWDVGPHDPVLGDLAAITGPG